MPRAKEIFRVSRSIFPAHAPKCEGGGGWAKILPPPTCHTHLPPNNQQQPLALARKSLTRRAAPAHSTSHKKNEKNARMSYAPASARLLLSKAFSRALSVQVRRCCRSLRWARAGWPRPSADERRRRHRKREEEPVLLFLSRVSSFSSRPPPPSPCPLTPPPRPDRHDCRPIANHALHRRPTSRPPARARPSRARVTSRPLQVPPASRAEPVRRCRRPTSRSRSSLRRAPREGPTRARVFPRCSSDPMRRMLRRTIFALPALPPSA